ncbi:centromere protein F-like [Centruroides sculpturatus]|uniref:centromere protein F-like n=1 Tax=Centruroides sculpturatus TaxID=218467 RepID=UPI000C6D0090|nr:centromere protein F-like [Centruroides sculpturatus]
MDWVASEWKQNLPPLAVQKINCLEEQVERLQKEKQQKQLQVESLGQNLDIQKRKLEEQKLQKLQVEREQQSLNETNCELEQKLQKMHQELNVKDSKIKCLENHLAQSKLQKENMKSKEKESTNMVDKFTMSDDLMEIDSKKEEKLDKELSQYQKCETPQSGSKYGFKHSDQLEKSRIDIELANEKIMCLEQKIIQLTKELECQRHNSEAVKLTIEQKFKEKENNFKDEIKNQTQALYDLEKQFTETKSKLQQELTCAQKNVDASNFQLEKLEKQKK